MSVLVTQATLIGHVLTELVCQLLAQVHDDLIWHGRDGTYGMGNVGLQGAYFVADKGQIASNLLAEVNSKSLSL